MIDVTEHLAGHTVNARGRTGNTQCNTEKCRHMRHGNMKGHPPGTQHTACIQRTRKVFLIWKGKNAKRMLNQRKSLKTQTKKEGMLLCFITSIPSTLFEGTHKQRTETCSRELKKLLQGLYYGKKKQPLLANILTCRARLKATKRVFWEIFLDCLQLSFSCIFLDHWMREKDRERTGCEERIGWKTERENWLEDWKRRRRVGGGGGGWGGGYGGGGRLGRGGETILSLT